MIKRILYDFQNEPSFRVNIARNDHQIDFYGLGKFTILDDQGLIVIENVQSERKWRVRLDTFEPAQFVYSLMIDTKSEHLEAKQIFQNLIQQGYEARIELIGGILNFNDDILSDNTNYRIHVGEFNSAEDALTYGGNYFNKNNIKVIKEKIREPRGVFEIFDSEYEYSVKIDNGLTITSSNADHEAIPWNILNSASPKKPPVSQYYEWPIRFCIGDSGEILAICEVSIENYLHGILSVEMGQNYPLEALKCQAIASRSLALARLGLTHHGEPYDLCNQEHCQVFHGLSDRHPKIIKAIAETRGEFLFHKGSLYMSRYSIHCGGHTEEGDDMVNGVAPYIQGIWDGPEKKQKIKMLDDEKTVSRWVTSEPHVYCNTNGHKNLYYNRFDKSHFRWEVSYSRQQLEGIIRNNTGEDIGTLFDILPCNRGKSGRLTEVEILGSRKNIRITQDSCIRRALSDDFLNSSCFIIETDLGNDGIPLSFSFIGAGTGHGVGMCQTGAAVMALKGKSYRNILKHYYTGSELKKIY